MRFRFVIPAAALLLAAAPGCGGSAAPRVPRVPESRAAPPSSQPTPTLATNPAPVNDTLLVQSFLRDLPLDTAAARTACDEFLMVGPGLWAALKVADPTLAELGQRSAAALQRPNGEVAQLEMRTFSDAAVASALASPAMRNLARQVTGVAPRNPSQTEESLVLRISPSAIPAASPIVVVDSKDWRLAFIVSDHKIVWVDDLSSWQETPQPPS